MRRAMGVLWTILKILHAARATVSNDQVTIRNCFCPDEMFQTILKGPADSNWRSGLQKTLKLSK